MTPKIVEITDDEPAAKPATQEDQAKVRTSPERMMQLCTHSYFTAFNHPYQAALLSQINNIDKKSVLDTDVGLFWIQNAVTTVLPIFYIYKSDAMSVCIK